ncbi:putative nuclease of restriction endonuclease-like (RecB) superfamily [Flavobacterium arsenatis]|uniref:Nuclease of restriction endonuclease-like (RecB) superfamily n=1 Tax=Flavobacterium arsenatis TaxID=1484332 RepID=A0ABU1TQZ1_9FLAO|nr:PDDEXK nuclease domain-containing protein [Flavobacterium arsenatis]MDR6968386.1 putative nuclease of restriction endonuclease-like (RecB) superfamily [Flavobacterium arsenatis]
MNFSRLIQNINQVHIKLQQQSISAVNRALTIRNWMIGYYIVEFEQKGIERAKYGENLIENLALALNTKGLSFRNLKLFRQFYLNYPEIGQTLPAEFKILNYPKEPIGQTLPAQSYESINILDTLLSKLSFSHFSELMKITETEKRTFYEVECITGIWSTRELKRQIESLYFERSGLSKAKKELQTEVNRKSEKLEFKNILKDYYVFEFLDLPNQNTVSESELETELLTHIQQFILELGNGFCFESRQKRILIGEEYFYIDLVFYHRILKCHILIELKIESFNHYNAGQLNTYINYYNKEIKLETDNPTIGILLVTNQNKALVEYATAGMEENLFVRNYLVQLPDKNDLKNYIENELKQIQNNHS